MFSRDDVDAGAVFSVCRTASEVLVIVNHLAGHEVVEKLLMEMLPVSTREGLWRDALELKCAGLVELSNLVRRYARKAKPKPETHWWTIADKAERRAAFECQGGEERRQPLVGRAT
jgi:hypothetical protein